MTNRKTITKSPSALRMLLELLLALLLVWFALQVNGFVAMACEQQPQLPAVDMDVFGGNNETKVDDTGKCP